MKTLLITGLTLFVVAFTQAQSFGVSSLYGEPKFSHIEKTEGYIYYYTPSGQVGAQAIKTDSIFKQQVPAPQCDMGNGAFCLVLHVQTIEQKKIISIQLKDKTYFDLAKEYFFIPKERVVIKNIKP